MEQKTWGRYARHGFLETNLDVIPRLKNAEGSINGLLDEIKTRSTDYGIILERQDYTRPGEQDLTQTRHHDLSGHGFSIRVEHTRPETYPPSEFVQVILEYDRESMGKELINEIEAGIREFIDGL